MEKRLAWEKVGKWTWKAENKQERVDRKRREREKARTKSTRRENFLHRISRWGHYTTLEGHIDT